MSKIGGLYDKQNKCRKQKLRVVGEKPTRYVCKHYRRRLDLRSFVQFIGRLYDPKQQQNNRQRR